jgi:hypothetical protein
MRVSWYFYYVYVCRNSLSEFRTVTFQRITGHFVNQLGNCIHFLEWNNSSLWSDSVLFKNSTNGWLCEKSMKKWGLKRMNANTIWAEWWWHITTSAVMGISTLRRLPDHHFVARLPDFDDKWAASRSNLKRKLFANQKNFKDLAGKGKLGFTLSKWKQSTRDDRTV